MKIQLVVISALFFFDQILCEHFVDQFYDDADLKCGIGLNFPKEEFHTLFDDKLRLIAPENDTVIAYTRCWFYNEGITKSNGDLILDKFNKWFTTDVFKNLQKNDLEKFSMDTRQTMIKSILEDCNKNLNINNNIQNVEAKFYNCIMNGLADI